MALFSAKKEKAVVRRASYKTGLLAAQSYEAVEAQKARAQAAEEAALDIYGRLGAPGTFEGPPTAPSLSPSDIYQTSGPLTEKSKAAQGLLSKYSRLKEKPGTQEKYGTGAETLFDPRTGILDPKKYGDVVQESAAFRIQSRQTAEAEQLLRQEGPMWDMLNNSTIGRIYEGAALQNKEALRSIRDNLAKGGSARRTAFAQAQELIQIEKAHQMRTQETWTANLQLHDYIRKNADRVQTGNIQFLNNLPELRANYSQTMTALTDLMTSKVVPYSMQGIQEAAASEQAIAAKDGLFLEGLIMAGVTAAAGMVGVDLGGISSALISSSTNTQAGQSPQGFGSQLLGAVGAGAGGLFGDWYKNRSSNISTALNESAGAAPGKIMQSPENFGSGIVFSGPTKGV